MSGFLLAPLVTQNRGTDDITRLRNKLQARNSDKKRIYTAGPTGITAAISRKWQIKAKATDTNYPQFLALFIFIRFFIFYG